MDGGTLFSHFHVFFVLILKVFFRRYFVHTFHDFGIPRASQICAFGVDVEHFLVIE